MYEFFAYPILKTVFEKLLQTLKTEISAFRLRHRAFNSNFTRFNLTGCNFGPTVAVREIKACPIPIDGQHLR